MLQLLVLLLLLPMSSCDAPSLSSHDQAVSEEEYNAMKLLWEQKHKEIADHQEVKQSKVKPSYINDININDHHFDLLDLSSLTKSHHHQIPTEQTKDHKTSHEQSTVDGSHDQQVTTIQRSRRQQVPDGHIVIVGSGSGSGVVLKCDDPPVPSNGDFMSNGSVVTYLCEEGFALVGNRQRFCNLTSWQWNGSDPTCEGITTGPCVQDEPYRGSCDQEISQYYYHMTQDRCLPFDGCPAVEVGDNSYDSLLSCRGGCMAPCNDSEGIVRFHRSVWSTQDCQLCNCTNGMVTCDPMDLMECPALFCGEDDPITLVEGCCPVCPTESCNTTDVVRIHDEMWTTEDCEQCLCTNGRVTCSPPNMQSCDPVDNCSNGVIEISIDTMCCPVCKPNVTMGACEYNGMMYYNGETFMEDLCTMCQCNDATVTCTTETCADCEQGTTAANVSNQCCPKCLPGCELMENEPETIEMFGLCHSITPVVKHSCPEQCIDNDVIKCCFASSYVTKATTFECVNLPGVEEDLKYSDANDCTCDPCG